MIPLQEKWNVWNTAITACHKLLKPSIKSWSCTNSHPLTPLKSFGHFFWSLIPSSRNPVSGWYWKKAVVFCWPKVQVQIAIQRADQAMKEADMTSSPVCCGCFHCRPFVDYLKKNKKKPQPFSDTEPNLLKVICLIAGEHLGNFEILAELHSQGVRKRSTLVKKGAVSIKHDSWP